MNIIIKHGGCWCLQFFHNEKPAKGSKIRLEFNGPNFGLINGTYIITSVNTPDKSLSQFAWEVTIMLTEDEPDLPITEVVGYD